MVEWVEPDVEAHGVDDTCFTGALDQISSVGGRQRKRFLADDVFSFRKAYPNLVGVDVVRTRDVNNVDVRVGGEGPTLS